MSSLVKLKAVDQKDFGLVASLMQDAAIVASDLHFDQKAKQFIIMGNRYRWEQRRPWWQRGLFAKKHPGERIRTALHLNSVLSVKSKGLDVANKEQVLALLDIVTTPYDALGEGLSYIVDLIFAGGVTIQLEVEVLEMFMTDMGEGFEALVRPDHTKVITE